MNYVELYRTVQLGSCDPEIRCPVFPVLFYQRGEARIAIDQVGQIFEEIEGGGGDASAFPFFTGEEDQAVSNEGHSGRASVIRQYDVNNNGMTERSEAIMAVLDYFDGLISKDEALAVVATYYST